jgi:Domain of unknown function (DUF4129)
MMRGRATGVVLPALVVLGLVTVVAITATGSTPAGSDASRAPSDTLLDTFFTLGIVAVVAGGLLLVYGLMQRRAIAREVASGRYRRTSLLGWLAFVAIFTAFSYWRMTNWTGSHHEAVDEPVFGSGKVVPITPESKPTVTYEPSISWLAIVVVLALVLAATVAYVVAERRSRAVRESAGELAEQLAIALDDAVDDLRAETDARRAVVAAYARLERILAASGIPRRPAETSDEYLTRVLHDLAPSSDAIGRLTHLFAQAKFSHHEIDTSMKEAAIDALEQARDELRLAMQKPKRHSHDQATPAEVTR